MFNYLIILWFKPFCSRNIFICEIFSVGTMLMFSVFVVCNNILFCCMDRVLYICDNTQTNFFFVKTKNKNVRNFLAPTKLYNRLQVDRYKRLIQKSELNSTSESADFMGDSGDHPIQSEYRIGIGRTTSRKFRPHLPPIATTATSLTPT
jgi:hypothetical protein